MTFLKIFLIAGSMFFLQGENICFHLESRNLAKGKMIVVKADVYYKFSEGKMITHYTYPADYIIITNRKGEAQVYNPKTNTVFLKRGFLFSTDIDVVNLFLTERYFDMGLKDMNYKMINTKNDKGYVVTTWVPEKVSDEDAQKIEMAHQNSLPVYMALFDKNGKVSKKVYYSNYSSQGQYFIPIRVTEIAYIPNGDSVITKKEYADFKLGPAATGGYFNFAIPKDAKMTQ